MTDDREAHGAPAQDDACSDDSQPVPAKPVQSRWTDAVVHELSQRMLGRQGIAEIAAFLRSAGSAR